MLKKALGLVATAAILGSVSAIGGGPATPVGSAQATVRDGSDQAEWRARASMPEARAEVGVAALGDRVYVVGGTLQRGDEAPEWASDLVTSYDPRADSWRQHAPLPRPLSHVAVATLDGELYAVGGFTGIVHFNPQQVAYVYNPRSDRWRQLPDMPEKLGSVGVAAVDGKLHVIGGRDSRTSVVLPGIEPPITLGFGSVRSHQVYDPTRRRWSEAPLLPGEARDHAGTAVLGHHIHVFGGRVEDGEDNLARHDVYNTRNRRWTTAAPLPTPRSAGASVVLNGRIVFAGGECKPAHGGTYDDVTAYSPRTDRWTMLPALPQARHAFGAGRVGDRAFFVGGALDCGGGASVDTLELNLTR